MTLAVIPVYWYRTPTVSEVKQPRARVALGWVRLGNEETQPYQPSRTELGETNIPVNLIFVSKSPKSVGDFGVSSLYTIAKSKRFKNPKTQSTSKTVRILTIYPLATTSRTNRETFLHRAYNRKLHTKQNIRKSLTK